MPKITLAQFESKLCDPPANVVKAIPMIRQAGLDGSDMIMFPEMFTTGYELSIVGPRITELAEPVNGPTITALREAAKQAGVYVVAPIALYHDDLPGVPFNSAVLIDREGNVAGVYDKAASVGFGEVLFPGRQRHSRVPNRLRNHRHHDLL